MVFNWRKRDFFTAKENVDSPVIFEPMWYLIREKVIFSAAKENIDSPVIFEPIWYLIGEKEI